MTDRPGDATGDPPYPGQPGSGPPRADGSSSAPGGPTYPGQQPGYPGQQPDYPGQPPRDPGQQAGYSGQPPAYPGQPPAYPGQPPGYPGQQPPPYGGGYASGPTYPGGGYDGAPPPAGWSGWAIAAFICSLIPFLGILAALPLAIVALVKIRRTRQRGKLLAIAAILISVLWWVAAIGLGVAWWNDTAERSEQGVITEAGRIEFDQIRVGDCVDIPSLSSDAGKDVNVIEMQGVPCDEEHNAEVVGVVEIAGDAFPGGPALEEQSATQCAAEAATYLPGGLPPGVEGFRLVPTEEVWNDDGGHRSICFAVNGDFSDMDRSVRDQ
ncbi:MAG: septum formation family protein [Nocardioidaceae bacterium]|nr:septum formation family protein [Nocardioidaceae bacterium]